MVHGLVDNVDAQVDERTRSLLAYPVIGGAHE